MPATHLPDSRYSWFRLLASLALATVGGIGLWAGIVALPFIQADFGVDRAGASFPYTMTMIGFAFGGILMGRLSDRFGLSGLLRIPSVSNATLTADNGGEPACCQF